MGIKFEKNTPTENLDQNRLAILAGEIEATVGDTLKLETYENTYFLENDVLSLSFEVDEDRFTILNIEINESEQGEGHGTAIIEVIHAWADEQGLTVYARKVKSDSRGFWESVGYIPSAEEDDLFVRD